MSERQFTNNFRILAVAFTVVCLALPLAPLGYAEGYSAISVCSNNSVSATYFTVGLYTYTGTGDAGYYRNYDPSVFTPTDTVVDSEAKLSYSDGKISATDVLLTPTTLYLVIFPSDPADTSMYQVGSHTVTITDGDTPITSGITSTLTIGDPADQTSLQKNIAYRVKVVFSLTPTTIASDVITCGLSIDSMIQNKNNGTYVIQGCDIEYNTYEDIVEEVIDINKPGPGEPEPIFDLQPSDNTGSYGDSPAVNVSNKANDQGGIVEGNNGNIHITLKVPAGSKFIIAMYDCHSNKSQGAAVRITGSGGGSISATAIVPANSNGTVFFYLPINNGTFSHGSSMPATSDPNAWITMNGTISINIEKDSGNNKLAESTKFDLVFAQ